jgi:hypothetical protein
MMAWPTLLMVGSRMRLERWFLKPVEAGIVNWNYALETSARVIESWGDCKCRWRPHRNSFHHGFPFIHSKVPPVLSKSKGRGPTSVFAVSVGAAGARMTKRPPLAPLTRTCSF